MRRRGHVAVLCLCCAVSLAGCGRKPTAAAPAPAPAVTTAVAAVAAIPLPQSADGVFLLEHPDTLARFYSNPAPALILFYSRTSVPSVLISALLSRTATNYADRVRFGRVNLSDVTG